MTSLADVNGRIRNGSKTSHVAWAEVVTEDVGSWTFTQFHTECMAMLREVLDAFDVLPTRTREKFARYAPSWWNALVQPGRDWAGDFARIISEASLDMLESLADVLEVQLGPRKSQTVEVLRRSVERLTEEVEGAPALTASVRAQILADLAHVTDLLQQVETFGVQHVVTAVEKVAGRVMTEAAKSPTRTLKRLVVEFAVVLALLQPVVQDVEQIVGSIRSLFGVEAVEGSPPDTVESTVVDICNVCVPKALPAGPIGATEDSTTPDDEEVVDAEVVEDEDN